MEKLLLGPPEAWGWGGWYLDSDPCQSRVSAGGEEGGLN